MTKAVEIAGERFGRLTALERAFHRRRTAWLCRCDCGNETTVTTDSLRGGNTRSCGCLHTELRRQLPQLQRRRGNPKHGLCYSPEYNVWRMMKNRCLNPTVARFKDYGGRGIRVCERWLKFESFYADMGPRPDGVSSGGRALFSLERVDNDGPYAPGNCVWATATQQVKNRRADTS